MTHAVVPHDWGVGCSPAALAGSASLAPGLISHPEGIVGSLGLILVLGAVPWRVPSKVCSILSI